MAFPFLTVFIIFLVITYIRRESLSKRQREREEAFWAREEEAAHTPAKDLSTLRTIEVPLARFPIGRIDDDDLMMIEEELISLSKRRIMNLNGKTNTDIKIEYGTANFDVVSRMGEDFDRLIMVLCDYAKGLMQGGYDREAVAVLEYGAQIGSDISANYTLLGECYHALGRDDELERLKEEVRASELPLKESILAQLEQPDYTEPDKAEPDETGDEDSAAVQEGEAEPGGEEKGI